MQYTHAKVAPTKAHIAAMEAQADRAQIASELRAMLYAQPGPQQQRQLVAAVDIDLLWRIITALEE